MRPCHRLNLPLGILAALSILTGCFQVPIRGQGDIGENRRTTIIGAKSQNDNREIASYDPYASTAQRIESGNIAALGGTSVTLEPGALAVPANIVIEEGQPLKETSIMSELGIQDSVKVTGSAPSVIVRPEENASLQKPMTLEIPLPSMGLWATMMEDDPYSNVVILARTYRDGEGVVSSLLPRSAFETSNGKARFETTGFGTFQAVVLDTKVEEKIEAKSSEPIRNVANVPVVTDSGIVPTATITQKEEQPAVAWAPLVVSFDGKTRNLAVQARQISSYTLSQCRVVLRENVDIPTPLEVLPDANLSAVYTVTRKDAHTLYARMQCIDNLERTTYSAWSDAVVIPADIKPLPVISSVTIAPFAADGINAVEHSRSEPLVAVAATDYERLAYAIVANPTTTLDCATVSNYVAAPPTPVSLTADGSFGICVKAVNADGAAVYGKTSSFLRDIMPPAVASFVGINEAADGIVSLTEVSSAKPALEINASGHTKIEFTGFLFAGAVCDNSQTYTHTVLPAINTLPSADGDYIVCARLADDVGNTTFKVSATIAKQTGVPTFSSLTLGSAVSDGYLNMADSAMASSLVGSLSASGYSTATYAVATSATPCETIATWSASVATNNAGFVSEESYKVCVRLQDSIGNVGYGFSANFMRDITPPTPSGKILTTGESNGAYTLTWSAASDNQSSPGALQYCPAQSTSASFDTIDQVMGGTMVGACFNGTSALTSVLPATTSYYFNVVVKDQAGNKAVYTRGETQWFTVTTPAAGTVIGSGTIGNLTMAGSCAPNGATISINSPVSQSATCVANSWSATLDLSAQSDDNISLAAGMNDGAGSSALSQSVTINKNTVAPTATFISGTPAALSNTSALNVTIGGSNVAEYQYALITSPAVCSGAAYTTYFTVATPITETLTTDGLYILCVKGRDVNLNTQASASEHSWTRDATAPTVNVGGDLTAITSVTINATTSDASSLIFAWTKMNGPGTITFSNSTGEDTNVSANMDGIYTLRLTVTDAAGNSAYGELNFTYDTTPPNITSFIPAGDAVDGYLNASEVSTATGPFAILATDGTSLNYSDIIPGVSVTCDGSKSYPNTSMPVLSSVPTLDNHYTVCVQVQDLAGNVSYAGATIERDTAAPVLSSFNWGGTASDGFVGISETGLTSSTGTLTESGSSEIRYSAFLNNNPPVVCDGSQTYPNTILPALNTMGADGAYAVCIRLRDAAGNVEYGKTPQLVRDINVPVFTSMVGANGAADGYVNSSEYLSPSALLTLSASGYTTANYTGVLPDGGLACDGSQTYGNGSIPTISDIPGSDGSYAVCVELADEAGNIAYGKSPTVVRDVIAPIFTSLTPANEAADGYVNSSESSSSQVFATLTASGQSSTNYSTILPDAPVTCDGSKTYTNSSIPAINTLGVDYAYALCVQLTDVAGNVTYGKSASVIKDTTAPSVNAGTDINAAATVSTSATASGADTYSWTKITGPGSVTFSAVNSLNTSVTAVGDGAYVLRLTAMDAAGNSYYDELTLNWDATGPQLLSFVGTNEASDGYINNMESTSPSPALVLDASGYTQEEYSSFLDDTTPVTCDAGQTYGNSSIPSINSLTEDGHYVVCVKLTDATPTTAYFKSAVIVRDTQAPTITVTNTPIFYTNIGNFSVTINDASTPQQELAGYQYAKDLSGDGITPPNCTGATYEPKVDATPAAYSINGNISIAGDGYYALCLVAYDVAGNISSAFSHTFHLDSTPPGNATLSNLPGTHTNAANFNIYVQGGNLPDTGYYDRIQIAAPKASNCDGMTGSEPWQDYTSEPTQISINLSYGDGQYTICARLKDKAGNLQATYTQQPVFLDTVAPSPGGSGIVNLQTLNGATTANIAWSAAIDASSGIASYALYASTSTALTTESEMMVGSHLQMLPNNTYSTSSAITPGSPYTFNIVVTDLAGNRAIYAPTTTRNLMVTSPTSGSTLGFELSGSIMMNGTCQGEGQIIHILSPVPVTNIATCASGGWSTATPIDLGNLTNGNHNVVLRLGQGTNSTADASISLNINKAINTIPNKVGSQGTSSYRVYPNINYGLSVAVSDNELIMAVGAPNDSLDNGGSNPVEEAGAIYLYHRTTAGATWNAPIKLTAPMRMPFQHFGKVIALSGNTLVVGLPEFSSSTMMSSTDMKEYAGAVLVYNYASPSWSTPTMITAPVRHAKDYFGISVAAISGKILVGADGHHAYDGGEINITHREAGKAFLFTQSAGWVFERSFELNVSQLQEYSGFGAKVAMTSDHIVIGAPNFDVDSIDTGAAFAWYWNGSNWTEYGIVQAPLGNRYAYDCFGSSIAILGSYMAIGAPYHDYDSTNTTAVADSGAVYPFIFSTGTWNTGTPAKITIPVTNNRRDSDFFGANVAFSGTTGTPKLLIGAENYQFDASSADQKWGAGAVFIYGYSTGWSTPSTKVLSLGRQQGDGFGASLAGFNTTVAVGIPDFDYDSTGLTNFSPGSGAVYYCNDTICSSLNTTFPTPATQMLASPNGKFGYDLAISEDELTLVVGAPGDNTNTVPTFKEKAGAIYIFHRYDRTQPWTLTQKITPSNLSHDWAAGDQFGFSVDISQDFIIVGAPYHGDNISTGNYLAAAGAAFIFQRSGGVGTAWNQFGSKLIPSGAYGRNANDYFGSSVAIYADGVNVTAAIGAPGHDYDSSDAVSTIVESSGAVFLFIKAGGNFAPDSKIATNLNGSRYAYEKFGTSLDLEGTRLVVGAPQHQYDENGNYPLIDAGAVFVYDKSTQWFPTVKLTANMAAMSNARSGYDYFGYSVALSNNTIVVGAPGHSYDMYGNNPSWDAGGAFVFKFNGSGWSYDAKLLSATRNPGDFFGKMVAVRGRTIGISAPGDDYDLYGGGNYMKDAGAGYIFHKSPTSWDMVQRLAPENSHRQDRDKFGYGIAVSPSALVFGAPEQNYSPASPNLSPDTGAVFTFNRTP